MGKIDLVELILEKYLGERKIAVIATLIIFCLLFTCFFIYFPLTLGSPHILVGNRILFTLDKKFSTCVVELTGQISVDKIAIFPDYKQKEMRSISTIDVKSNEKKISIPPPSKQILADDSFKNVLVEIFYPKFTQAKIKEVVVNGEVLNLKQFFNENLRVIEKKYIDEYFIREYISHFLIAVNDKVSNWLMTPLLVVCIILLGDLAGYGVIYFFPKEWFKKYLCKTSCLVLPCGTDQIESSMIVFGEIHNKRDIWYRFFQIFGPAFGFLFTITSLIAGLHPSAQIGRDISQFFSSIQVAMTSTFLGLFMRVISMWLQIVNNKIFDRADLIFQELKSPIPQVEMVEENAQKV